MHYLVFKSKKNYELNKIFVSTLLFFCSFPLWAQINNASITGHAGTIKQAFELIESQTSYTIAYNQSKFDIQKKVTFEFTSIALTTALNMILKDTGFTYKINGNHIIITPVPKGKKENSKSESPKQTLRGTVTDEASGAPLPFVTVAILNSTYPQGTTTDSLGHFHLNNLPVGRYDLQISFVGYEPAVIRELLLTSAKEINCQVSLREQLVALDEVIVQAPVNKEQTLNAIALTGGRMVSMEEAGRYAGACDDPARLVTSFAGVAGNFSTNAIAVRGNSPQFLQWKLEGIEVPNPTHFADMTGIGGGIMSALSSQVMGNSDFFNGAFPAEYSNALSGVFDMSMRNGNNQKHEHTFQFGTLGIDFASEGPFSSKKQGSYIFNYRYSTTGLIKGVLNDLDLNYQDLSFKMNFPTRKSGTFSIWGIGLIDRTKFNREEDRNKWINYTERCTQDIKMAKAAGGINHKYQLKNNAYIKTSLGFTYSKNEMFTDVLNDKTNEIIPIISNNTKDYSFVFNSHLNKKFGPRHTNRTGIIVTALSYDMDIRMSPSPGLFEPMEKIVQGDGLNAIISPFSTSVIRLNEHFTANIGVTAQIFTLNDNFSIEPRAAIRWKPSSRNALSLAYGLHSRHEKLDYYYIKTQETGDKLVNKDLDFAKAHHLVLSYSHSFSPNINLKIEPYYQYLFDVPVEPGTSFSVINHNLYYLDRVLVNKGEGRNYGIDLTLERYLNKGYYYLLTGSVFKSEYCGGDGIWRDTRMARGYIFNALGGKEWMCGRHKQNIFSANLRLSFQGGDRYTPFDLAASEESKDVEYDETRAFSEQFPSLLSADLTLSYKINRKRVAHEFCIKLLNATGKTEQFYYTYNEKTNFVDKEELKMFLPNISYKIQF